MVEHRIDHAGLVARIKSMGDIDIFGNADLWRHILALADLIDARPHDRAQHNLDAHQRPAFGQRIVDGLVDLGLMGNHPADNILEKREFRLAHFQIVINLLTDPMGLEFRTNVDHPLLGDVHFIQGLHRRHSCG